MKKLQFESPEDYRRAAVIYGEVLEERNYKPALTPMWVLPEDEAKLLPRLEDANVPFSEVTDAQ